MKIEKYSVILLHTKDFLLTQKNFNTLRPLEATYCSCIFVYLECVTDNKINMHFVMLKNIQRTEKDMVGWLVKANYSQMGPGLAGKVHSVGVFLRDPSSYNTRKRLSS